jgi:hypothetical protein
MRYRPLALFLPLPLTLTSPRSLPWSLTLFLSTAPVAVAVPATVPVPDADAASGSFDPGLLGRLRRPSVARSVWSENRTGRIATTLIPRAAASIEAGRDAPGRRRRGVPGMTMCGTGRRAGRLVGHIVKPGTSRCRGFSAFHRENAGWVPGINFVRRDQSCVPVHPFIGGGVQGNLTNAQMPFPYTDTSV